MKNFLFRLLFFGLLAASLAYVIPDFSTIIGGKVYRFDNLNGLNGNPNLLTSFLHLNPTHRYQIESAATVSDLKGWNEQVANDQKTLEQRIKEFTNSNNYEVRLDRKDGKALFTIDSLDSLGQNTAILTNSNSEFKVSVVEPTVTAESADQTQKTTNLNLTRSDFGHAEVSAVPSGTGSNQQVTYQIKAPIGLLGPEKLKLINEKLYSGLNVSVGGKEYSASFEPNTSNVVTGLVLTGIESPDEAQSVNTYLNTGKYNLGYKFLTSELNIDTYGWAKFLGFIVLFLLSAVLINLYTVNNLSLRKLFQLLSYVLIGLAVTKLLSLEVTNGYVLVLAALVLFTLYKTRNAFYIGLAVILLLFKVTDYLYFLQIRLPTLLLLLAIGIFIWSANYSPSLRALFSQRGNLKNK